MLEPRTVSSGRFRSVAAVLLGAGLLWSAPVLAQPSPRPEVEPAYYKGKPTSFWIKKLGDEEAAVRREAVMALGAIGPEAEAAVPGLLRALDDDDTGVRQEAMTTLGHIGPAARAAIPALLRALRDKDAQYQSLAVDALGGIGPEDEAVIPTLVKMLLEDDREMMRWRAAWALKTIGSKARSALPELTRGLQSQDDDLRNAAATVVGAIGPEALPQLLTVARDPKLTIRLTVYDALRNMGPKARDAFPVLAEVLKSDSDPEMRNRTVWLLADIGLDSLPVLIQALQNRDPEVRGAVVKVITQLGPGPKTRAALGPLLDLFKDDFVGDRAAVCVAGFGSEAVGPVLEILKNKNSPTKALSSSKLALLRLGANAREAVPSLVEMLKLRDIRRDIAVEVLPSIGPDAVPALVKAVQDKDNEYAAPTLARLGANALPAVPEVQALLKDPDPRLRVRAVRILGWLSPEVVDALSVLREAIQDSDENVRETAKQMVARLERLRLERVR
jgi:HEAT repeat protein